MRIQVFARLGAKAVALIQCPFVKSRHILLQVSEVSGSVRLGNASELIVVIHHAVVLRLAVEIVSTAVLQVEVMPQLVDKSAHANIAVGSFPIGFAHGHHETGRAYKPYS